MPVCLCWEITRAVGRLCRGSANEAARMLKAWWHMKTDVAGRYGEGFSP